MPTLSQTEATLVGPPPEAGSGLVGGLLESVEFDCTGPSPVASLAPALSQGLIACKVIPADVTAITDADMARLAGKDWPKFLDIASLTLLEIAAVQMAGMPKEIRWEDYDRQLFGPDEFTKLLANRQAQVKLKWGYGGTTLGTGTIQIRSAVNGGPEF